MAQQADAARRRAQLADSIRLSGNDSFKNKDFETAQKYYSQAIKTIEECLKVLPGDPACTNTLTACLRNRALVAFKSGQFEQCEVDCCKALDVDPVDVKALARRGFARIEIGRLAEAQRDLEGALPRSSGSMAKEIASSLEYLSKLVAEVGPTLLTTSSSQTAAPPLPKAGPATPREPQGHNGVPLPSAVAAPERPPPLAASAPNVVRLSFTAPDGAETATSGSATPAYHPSVAQTLPAMSAHSSPGEPGASGATAVQEAKGAGSPVRRGGDPQGAEAKGKVVGTGGSGEAKRLREDGSAPRDVEHVASAMGALRLSQTFCAACNRTAQSKCKRCNFVVYCNKHCQASHWKFHKKFCLAGVEDPSPKMTPQTRRGFVGLVNLGNSCYMNSAIACLSHVYPITRHFLSGVFKEELNLDNPMGSGGRVATAYEDLLKQLWFGERNYTTGRDLKRAIDIQTDRFRGHAQHDAVEYTEFMLDMIHEDLNRVKKKEYVETPDAGDRPDAVVGEECWRLHRRRNDSVVTDHVTGIYKSTLRCHNCQAQSRKFEPFLQVNLELPVRTSRALFVLLVRYAAPGQIAPVPIRHAIEIRKTTPIGEVRHALAELSGVEPEDLVLWESYKHRPFQYFTGRQAAFKLAREDIIIASEVPESERSFSVTVVHRLGPHRRTVFRNDSDPFFGQPLVVPVDVDLTVRGLKELVLRQIDSWLPKETGTDPEALRDSFMEEILVGQVESRSLSPLPGSSPLALSHYRGVDEDTPLVRALVGDKPRPTVVFEWPEHLQKLLDVDGMKAVDEHPSCAELQHLDQPISLQECFDRFCAEEELGAGSEYYCGKCKEHVEGTKSMSLYRVPEVLIIQLKRFAHQMRFGIGLPEKLQDLVQFPLDGLDVSPYLIGETAGGSGGGGAGALPAPVYDLFGTINHYGHANFGHYTAFARSGEWSERDPATGCLPSGWLEYDDDLVQVVRSSNRVVCPAAYVLFYRRRDPPPAASSSL
uniref:ubiquitinyl hydrolase 1 n=1 Tax=Rhizochromulina marina TaxID=1034831 RepID=A0A7S2STD1_9STRA|mmetsp:Transcript_5263/g.15453  ORF Transcript_5263/g.15453 Transcript_5263/m.15453 type:complete len:991 (+) Transcript_5263:114-3086(+)